MVANAAMFAAASYGYGALLRGCHGEYRRHPDFQFRDRGGKVVRDWHAAGAAMNHIRVLVANNLLFEALTIVVATLGTCLGRERVRSR